MPLFTTLRRALPAAALFASYAFATCWYPDGTTQSSDIPCNPENAISSCCSAQSFCLAGGGCFTGGVVTRGSCTDKNWGPECAQFCRTDTTDGDVPITPCNTGVSDNEFVCNLDNSQCSDSAKTFTLSSSLTIALRPSQVKYLVKNVLGSSLASASAASSAASSETTDEIVGAVCGVGIPLLIVIGVLSFLLIREKRKYSGRGSMYKLPDNETKETFTFQPPPTVVANPVLSRSSNGSAASSRPGSAHQSVRTMTSPSPRPSNNNTFAESQRPTPIQSMSAESRRPSTQHIPSFAERIESMKVAPQIIDIRESRHELDSNPSTPREEGRSTSSPRDQRFNQSDVERFELASHRMSK